MLSQKEVYERSRTLQGAKDVSAQHWEEIANATDSELDMAPKYLLSSLYCGLCQYHRTIQSHGYCVLCPYFCGLTSAWNAASKCYCLKDYVQLRYLAERIVKEIDVL